MKVDFWSQQLQLAHRRNDFVDDLRFKIFQIFFVFYGVVLTGLVYKGKDLDAVRATLGGTVMVVPSLVLLVVWSMQMMFLSWQRRLYHTKAWIAALEEVLVRECLGRRTQGPRRARYDYTGAYYLGESVLGFRLLEPIGLAVALAMAGMNIGVGTLLLQVLQASPNEWWLLIVIGVLAHLVSIGTMLFRRQKFEATPDDDVKADT